MTEKFRLTDESSRSLSALQQSWVEVEALHLNKSCTRKNSQDEDSTQVAKERRTEFHGVESGTSGIE